MIYIVSEKDVQSLQGVEGVYIVMSKKLFWANYQSRNQAREEGRAPCCLSAMEGHDVGMRGHIYNNVNWIVAITSFPVPDYLQFLELGTTPGVQRVFLPPVDDGVSSAIGIPGEGFPFGSSIQRNVYVRITSSDNTAL